MGQNSGSGFKFNVFGSTTMDCGLTLVSCVASVPHVGVARYLASSLHSTNQRVPRQQISNQNAPKIRAANQNTPRIGDANQNTPRIKAANQNTPRIGAANQNMPRIGAANQNTPRIEQSIRTSQE